MTDTPAALSRRISLPRLIGFSALGIPTVMMGVVLALFLPRYYAGLMGLAAAGFAFTIVRLLDVVIDPILGVAMDATRTPIGKYRPWIIASAPVMALAIWMLMAPPAHPSGLYLILWLLVFYLGGSMFNLAQAAWAASLASDYAERPRVFGWMQIVGILAGVVFLLLGPLTGGRIQPAEASSMTTVAMLLIIMIPIAFTPGVLLAPDRPLSNRPAAAKAKFSLADYVTAIRKPDMVRLILADFLLTLGPGLTGPIYLFFFHDAKHFSIPVATLLIVPYAAAGLIGSPVWARVAARFGKHRLIQIACVAYGITQTILMAIPAGLLIPTAIGIFAVGFCASAFVIAIRAMVADIADVVLLEHNKDLSSVLFAMVTTTTKIGTSITSGVTFGILALVGYTAAPGVQNTPTAIFGLEMVYLFAPIVLVFVGAAMVFGYKLDATAHAEVRRQLAEREFAASEESLTGQTIG